MDHIAIMNKKMGYIDSIVNGTKVIESRWYKYKRDPWNKIKKGDVIYFKDSGKSVSAKAIVDKVIQIENLNEKEFNNIVSRYADLIQMRDRTYSEYYQSKNYVILIFLKDSKYIDIPFNIDKKGYGVASAWMCVENIEMIKV